jgi:DNA polymerase-3 subunit delta'
MTAAQFLPWQLAPAHQWLGNRDRFAHAWLIHGPAGIGKLQFAMAAQASLLCESPQQGIACGSCAACGWVSAGNHPDLRRLRPEAIALTENAHEQADDEDTEAPGGAVSSAKRTPSKEIKVAQIRKLEPWFNTATHRGGWRVALLYPAQALNVISANALLKILEEPPAHTVFLLVADALDHLLPTLLSRCRRLPLMMPSSAQALQWLSSQGIAQPADSLAAAGGAPLSALRLAQSGDGVYPAWLESFLLALAQGQTPEVSSLVDQLEKTPPAQWLVTLQRLYVDLTLAKVGQAPRYFLPLGEMMARLAARVSAVKIAEGAHWLTRQRRVDSHPLNAKLFAHATLQRVVLSCQL